MKAPVDFTSQDFHESIVLPAQYNNLLGRPVPALLGEYRLLWAVLEDAIKTYLSNIECRTRSQRRAFEEVRCWFRAEGNDSEDLFAFQTICDLLEIDSRRLLRGLKSICVGDLPIPLVQS